MDFIDKLRDLSVRIARQSKHLETEEATKHALVMPFISALGYNVFDPTEVVPEFTADVGVKRGEKVDYAILKDGKPIILIECKSYGTDLDKSHASQLYRYFSVTQARFGVLTNGSVYRFFSDLDQPNMMDSKAFFEFDMSEVSDQSAEELKKFANSSFDLDDILATASDLKYTREIIRLLGEQLREPTEHFVRFFVPQVYSGRVTQSVVEQFTQITHRAFQQFVTERVSDRLNYALAHETGINANAGLTQDNEVTLESVKEELDNKGIETTQEELEGYFTVKALLRDSIDVSRVTMRDTKSYCGVLLDDNNRKPICRLRFNSPTKYLGILDESKNEERFVIESVDDILKYANRIKATALSYDSQG